MIQLDTAYSLRAAVLAASAIALLMLTGCGGGFGSDSDNASELRHTIFGSDQPDTTAN